MNNGFYYQFLASVTHESANYNLPRYLKDLMRKGDIEDVHELQEFFRDELSNVPLADREGVSYFTFLSELALLFSLYREDFESFQGIQELMEKRFQAIKAPAAQEASLDSWKQYFDYLNQAALRLMRNTTIEQFENLIDEIDWSELEEDFIYRISGLTGFVYLNEEDKGRFNKARFWLQKAISEVSLESGLVFHLNLATYYFAEPKLDLRKRIEDHIKMLEGKAGSHPDPNMARLLKAAVLELQAKALIFKFAMYDDDQVKLDENLSSVREIEKNIDYEGKNAPTFVRAFLKMEFGKYYLNLTGADLDLDAEDIEDLLAMAHDDINEAMAIAKKVKDDALMAYNRVNWLAVVCERNTKVAEKDLREIVSNIRKGNNYPMYVNASRHLAKYYLNQNSAQKAYELQLELLKKGNKRVFEGGFYLIHQGIKEINNILLVEAEKPGISWMVTEMENFFERITEIVDSLDNLHEHVGNELFNLFMGELLNFEPVSHYNIKVYLGYQLMEVKMMRISAIFRDDELARQMAERLFTELTSDNNPLQFISGQWDEFKNVPNSVRNKVLNKCISISKGDLPLAAEHLDFSYRNLRSYITFKEVNRLGFFLDEQRTNARQLEQGIRLMFFDLYKQGTIFEVVFDMPKFLVEYAKTGFSSQDLEEELNIKGTTAKKYIKIMMEIGLIKHERSIGRKHYYKLRKDNVMNRLGKDQKVLIG